MRGGASFPFPLGFGAFFVVSEQKACNLALAECKQKQIVLCCMYGNLYNKTISVLLIALSLEHVKKRRWFKNSEKKKRTTCDLKLQTSEQHFAHPPASGKTTGRSKTTKTAHFLGNRLSAYGLKTWLSQREQEGINQKHN